MNHTFFNVEEFLAHIGNANSGRYRRGSGKNPFQHVKNAASKWLDPNIKSGKDKAPQSAAEKTSREVKRGIEEASSAVGRMSDMKRRRYKSNASKMTEKELNDAIRRMRLEQEYDRLTAGTMRTGYDKIQDILGVTGNVAGIAASAATVASILRKMKSGQVD